MDGAQAVFWVIVGSIFSFFSLGFLIFFSFFDSLSFVLIICGLPFWTIFATFTVGSSPSGS